MKRVPQQSIKLKSSGFNVKIIANDDFNSEHVLDMEIIRIAVRMGRLVIMQRAGRHCPERYGFALVLWINGVCSTNSYYTNLIFVILSRSSFCQRIQL